jgi:hypothetical protein
MSYHILHNTLSGLGNGASCVSIPWTNQMGGTGTGSLCAVDDKQQLCGSTIAFQQALTDLGYPCAVTGSWMGTELQPLNDWRGANGITKNWSNAGGPTATECGMIGQQWNALKGGPTAAEPPSGGVSSTISPLLRRKIAAATLLTRTARPGTIKPAGGGGPTTNGDTKTNGGGAVPAVEEPGMLDKAKDWWGGLGDTTKYAIIGGGVIAVGGVAYLALK